MIIFAIGPRPISILDSRTIHLLSYQNQFLRSRSSDCKIIDSNNLGIIFFVFVDISTINVSPDNSSAINSCSRIDF